MQQWFHYTSPQWQAVRVHQLMMTAVDQLLMEHFVQWTGVDIICHYRVTGVARVSGLCITGCRTG